MTFQPVPAEAVERLREYDSATVCNVIELFGVRAATAGYTGGAVRAIYPQLPPAVGYATTATFRSAYPSEDEHAYLRIPDHVQRMQELPEPRILVVQDLDEPPAAATLGEIMCRLYRRFGCCGIVTSGAARDIEAVRRLAFPVFASSIIASHGHSRFEELHVPVNIHGLTVRPGDLLHADANGIVSVPNRIAEHVAAGCEEYAEVERFVIEYLERRDAGTEGYRKIEEEAARALALLSSRLRRLVQSDENAGS